MRSFQFDPFGEPIAKLSFSAVADEKRSAASKFALRLGVGLFWGLVVGIVAARVAYFNPDFAKAFCTVAANCFH